MTQNPRRLQATTAESAMISAETTAMAATSATTATPVKVGAIADLNALSIRPKLASMFASAR